MKKYIRISLFSDFKRLRFRPTNQPTNHLFLTFDSSIQCDIYIRQTFILLSTRSTQQSNEVGQGQNQTNGPKRTFRFLRSDWKCYLDWSFVFYNMLNVFEPTFSIMDKRSYTRFFLCAPTHVCCILVGWFVGNPTMVVLVRWFCPTPSPSDCWIDRPLSKT